MANRPIRQLAAHAFRPTLEVKLTRRMNQTCRRVLRCLSVSLAAFLATTGNVLAHASEQTFVLLLPTNVYNSVGLGIVVLTIAMLVVLPRRLSGSFLTTINLSRWRQREHLQTLTSCGAFVLLIYLLYVGVTGERDPLTNMLPVFIWTVWWIAIFALHGVVGNLWSWCNPWIGPYRILRRFTGLRPALLYPDRLASWPAVPVYMAFVVFVLADAAPDDPDRLATFVAAYWICNFVGMVLFGGTRWLSNCECFTLLFGYVSLLAPMQVERSGRRLGAPGWALCSRPALTVSQSVFVLCALAASSFDGLNETFWWLAAIGVNPLEFPGRSAVFFQTVAGILASALLLMVLFALSVLLTLKFAGQESDGPSMQMAFNRLALSLLPIAFGYHLAHFFPTFLVNIQYFLVALSDPLATGADYLGLGSHFVTTGFFNTLATVRIIWLVQCAFIVAGHALAVLVCHDILRQLFASAERALLAHVPLAILMVLYTSFSLWLLAAPRGA
ncbi:MAG: hypothetical protein OXB95_08000 [Rhodobacteraceae bacterium]|nr:hypothetical protein [Paracoccaceae bacterium]